jgi:RimJ/RimL family protein N-acetyltransferase
MVVHQAPSGSAIVDTQPELRTQRVWLRPGTLADAPAVTSACQDEDVARWTNVPVPYTYENAEGWLSGRVERWARRESWVWLVFEPGLDQLIAAVGLADIDGWNGAASLGYWAAPAGRGRGLVTEAARLVCAWGFASAGLERIAWYAFDGNERSRALAHRLGFTDIGRRRAVSQRGGVWQDELVADLLPGELTGPLPDGVEGMAPTDSAPWRPVRPDIPEATIETPRLLLRPWSISNPADFEAVRLASIDEQMNLWCPVLDSPDATLDGYFAVAANHAGRVSFAIVDKDIDHVIGQCVLHRIDLAPETASATVGYWLLPEGRGRGLVDEAVEAMVHWGHETHAITRFELMHALGNTASCGVAVRSGFELELESRKSWLAPDGTRADEHVHARIFPERA